MLLLTCVVGKFGGTFYLKILKRFADICKTAGFFLGLESVTLPISYKQIITEKLVLITKMLIHLANGL